MHVIVIYITQEISNDVCYYSALYNYTNYKIHHNKHITLIRLVMVIIVAF